ncbi:MAG TPA: class II aldolase/adducin family protein [Paraburkholderia sp.]|jgi:ribulose-5-phosphate 4-epimerase/fuculose-1-phosphate aldolase
MNAITQPSSIPEASSMHPDEWQARVQLAAAYRIFDMIGWAELIYNHITLRVPDSASGGERQFLINPFGLHYSEVTASNLVKIDATGRILEGSPYPVNPAGFVVHSAIHEGIGDAHCVMHTHTTAGVAVASSELGLTQDNFYSTQLFDRVAYHDFEGVTVRADEGPRLLASIGNRPAVILRNHGLLSWGETLPQAFVVLWTLNRACEIQVATHAMGRALPVSDAIAERSSRDALQFDPHHGAGQIAFDALVRKLDRVDTSYRT